VAEKVSSSAHVWKSGTGERLVDGITNLPSNLLAGSRGGINGFTGFNVPMESKNMRLILSKLTLDATKASSKYGICKYYFFNCGVGHDSEANSL